MYNLDDLASRLHSSELQSLCQQLQASLYAAPGQQEFDNNARKRLLQLLKSERDTRSREHKADAKALRFELPPLYKH